MSDPIHNVSVEPEQKSVAAKLTPEQIANWRTAMVGTFGSYALIMPEEQIQRLRDKMQEWANES
jgi:hypothetical protein